jgi:hypothetical protein
MTYKERDQLLKGRMRFDFDNAAQCARRAERRRRSRELKEDYFIQQREGAPAWANIYQPELRRLIQYLGIKGEVKIRRTSGVQKRGTHRYKDGVHRIGVSKLASAKDATEIVIHELTHARQLESFPSATEYHQDYKRESRYFGYKRNHYEVEARDNAKRLSDSFRIAT